MPIRVTLTDGREYTVKVAPENDSEARLWDRLTRGPQDRGTLEVTDEELYTWIVYERAIVAINRDKP